MLIVLIISVVFIFIQFYCSYRLFDIKTHELEVSPSTIKNLCLSEAIFGFIGWFILIILCLDKVINFIEY